MSVSVYVANPVGGDPLRIVVPGAYLIRVDDGGRTIMATNNQRENLGTFTVANIIGAVVDPD